MDAAFRVRKSLHRDTGARAAVVVFTPLAAFSMGAATASGLETWTA
jgi:hypothetical protein